MTAKMRLLIMRGGLEAGHRAGTRETPPPMKLGLCTIAFREKLLEDALNIAQQIGFDGVEIWGREPHISETYDHRRVRAARKMVESRGLEVAMFGSYLRAGAPPSDEEEEVTAEAALQTTQALGARVCRVWAGNVSSKRAGKEKWRTTVEELESACAMADNLDLVLAVEMHDGTLADTSGSTLRLIKDVGAGNLKVNYQARFGKGSEDAYRRLRAVLPHVVNVHAQNHRPAKASRDGRLEPTALADGLVDYQKILKILSAAGFDGFVEIEFVPPSPANKVKALALDYEYLCSLC